MSKDIKPAERISNVADLLPPAVLADIYKHLGDYIRSGGELDGGYVAQLARYAENVARTVLLDDKS